MKTNTKVPKTPFFAAFSVGAVLFSAHAGGGFATGYAHLSKVMVRPGQSVRKGQQIGRSGERASFDHSFEGVESIEADHV